MKTTKQLRAEFYGFIYKNLGEFAPIIKQEIKGRLNEYAKVFNKILVSEKAILEEKLKKERQEFDNYRNNQRKKEDKPYFNYDFLNKYDK